MCFMEAHCRGAGAGVQWALCVRRCESHGQPEVSLPQAVFQARFAGSSAIELIVIVNGSHREEHDDREQRDEPNDAVDDH